MSAKAWCRQLSLPLADCSKVGCRLSFPSRQSSVARFWPLDLGERAFGVRSRVQGRLSYLVFLNQRGTLLLYWR
jgi:hypothetical protein